MADQGILAKLDEWLSSNYAGFLQALAAEVVAEDAPIESRQAAILQLKNAVVAKSPAVHQAKIAKWREFQQRQAIQDTLFQMLSRPELSRLAAISLSEYAAISWPYRESAGLLGQLRTLVGDSAKPLVQIAALQTVGYACERMSLLESWGAPEVATDVIDDLLTTIVLGCNQSAPDVQCSAMKALNTSIHFLNKNFGVQAERDALFRVMLEGATAQNNPNLQVAALTCLGDVCEAYYTDLPTYMTSIFEVTRGFMKSPPSEDIHMASIDLWTAVAEAEQDAEKPQQYIQAAAGELTPLLLQSLKSEGENVDEDDNDTLRAKSAICLDSMCMVAAEAMIPLIIPFVEGNINSQDWQARDVAIVAFCTILEAPTEVSQLVGQGVQFLVPLLNDPHPLVRDSATDGIRRVCQQYSSAIPPNLVSPLFEGLVAKLQENPRTAALSCNAFFLIAQSLRASGSDPPPTNVLSPYLQTLLQKLLQAAERPDADQQNLMTGSLVAVSELVLAAAQDTTPILVQLLPHVLDRLAACIHQQSAKAVGMLLAVLRSVWVRSENCLAERGVPLLMEALQMRGAVDCEDYVFAAIAALAGSMDDGFVVRWFGVR